MKKRIFMLALVMGAVLSMCASAWATTYYTIAALQSEYGTVNRITIPARLGKNISIRVRANVDGNESNLGYAEADSLVWTWSQAPAETGGTNPLGSLGVYVTDSDPQTSTQTFTKTGIFDANLTGIIQAVGTVTVTATLKNGNDDAVKAGNGNPVGTFTSSITVTFSDEDADDVRNPTAEGSNTNLFPEDDQEEITIDTNDSRDPDSAKWDGLDPVFYHTINTESYDYGKTKPALGKVEKTKLSFKAGTEGTLVVPMTGPIEEFNVYIAGKDAVKLYGLEKGADDIPLTSANIKHYNIPFRVTAVTSTDTVKGKDAKEMAKNWKAAKDSVTIAFNGGKVQYKGFPLTFSMSNGNTGSKPVAKALKLDVTPNTAVPAWVASVKSTDYKDANGNRSYTETVTTNKATEAAQYEEDGYEIDEKKTTPVTDELYLVNGSPVKVESHYDSKNKVTVYDNDPTTDDTTADGWTFTNKLPTTKIDAGDADTDEYWYYSYTKYTYVKDHTKYVNKKLDKKDPLLEISAALFPEGGYGGDAEDKGGYIPETKYAVSADGPYLITVKAPKDEGVTIDVAQASFDYLGNVTAPGTVTIGGELTNKDKENKQAITLTVTNPSTKKKAAIKVTVIGKTAPVIDTKDNTFKFTEESETSHKLVSTKNVEAGKVPSAKFKAKGSKTIEYRLGAYTSYFDKDNALVVEPDDGLIGEYLEALSEAHADDEAYAEYAENRFSDEKYADMTTAEAFNAELVTKLTALGLSFDKAKGAVILANKSKKETKPTLDYTGDAFEPLRIVVTAVNGAGTDQAWADLGITGAKPKVSDKQVSIKGAVKKGDTFKFKLMAGKVAAEKGTADNSSNVKATDTDGALGDYGLALVTYDSMDVLVPATVHFEKDATIPAYDATKNTIVATDDELGEGETAITFETKEVQSGDKTIQVTTYTASVGVTLISGDKWVKSADLSLKNYGIIQVVNPATLAEAAADNTNKINKGVSVNLTLENFGATAKGKIKVAVDAKTSNGGDPATATNGALPGSNAALPNNGAAPAAKAKTNGTASLTYNGAAPEAEAEAEAEATEPVTTGAARTAADLTAGQQAFLAAKGLKVIAVLPEITANVEGQHEFPVELDEDAPEGAKMVYVPFPQNAEETEDDKIADFYGADSEPIEDDKVPADKDIIVAPWLREGVTYQPVIAAEDAE